MHIDHALKRHIKHASNMHIESLIIHQKIHIKHIDAY